MCESPFDPRAMLTLCFVDPKISWPSKWNILLVKEDSLVYFVMTLAICDKSLDYLTSQVLIHPFQDPFRIFHHSSIPYKMHFVWMPKHNH